MTYPHSSKQQWLALTVVAGLFFVFGFITWSSSQLIPYLKMACEVTDTESYLVATAFFAAYFFMAFPSSVVLRRLGFQRGMSVGLLVMSLGALLFVPAAQSRNFMLFLTGQFLIGTGMALLQTAVNPYVTILGPIESAAQRISIMGICNKIAGISAVYVLGSITLSNADEIKARLLVMNPAEKSAELNALAHRVIFPYVVIAAILVLLALVIFFLHLPEVKEEDDVAGPEQNHKRHIFQFPHLVLGALAIFFYVGVEVISYDTFTNFGTELGYPIVEAKDFAALTGYGLLAGYIFSIIAIPRFISQQKALFVLTVCSIFCVFVSMFTKGDTAVYAFACLGFTNSVVWPAIWPLAMKKLGAFTKQGSALLIMGIVGGAVLPPVYSLLARSVHSAQTAYWIMIPCYCYILYFAWRGHEIGINERKQ